MATIKRSKPHPRFGATKAQSERNAEARGLLNQVYQLEQDLAVARQPHSELQLENMSLRSRVAGLEGQVKALTSCYAILATGKVAT